MLLSPTACIAHGYVDRFETLQEAGFRDPKSYFHRFVNRSDEQSSSMAQKIRQEINESNLFENILPTRN